MGSKSTRTAAPQTATRNNAETGNRTRERQSTLQKAERVEGICFTRAVFAIEIVRTRVLPRKVALCNGRLPDAPKPGPLFLSSSRWRLESVRREQAQIRGCGLPVQQGCGYFANDG